MQHHPGFSCPLCVGHSFQLSVVLIDVQRTFANLEEDVETEDAWEIASRRASIISRRPSNHSIRFPHMKEMPSDSQSSIGIGFGPAAASVDELLGEESGTASEEGGLFDSAPLARQVTAVQESGAREAGDVDMPQALEEEEEDGAEVTQEVDEVPPEDRVPVQETQQVHSAGSLYPRVLYEEYNGGISPGWDDNPDLSGSLAVLTDPSMLDRAYSNPGSGPSTSLPIEPPIVNGGSASEARTLMNPFFTTFASRMGDRLSLEPQINGEGSTLHGRDDRRILEERKGWKMGHARLGGEAG